MTALAHIADKSLCLILPAEVDSALVAPESPREPVEEIAAEMQNSTLESEPGKLGITSTCMCTNSPLVKGVFCAHLAAPLWCWDA